MRFIDFQPVFITSLIRRFTDCCCVTSNVRRTVILLVSLAAVGTILAGVGTVVGMTGILADGQPTEFQITEETVTVTDRGETYVLTDDLSNVTSVELVETAPGKYEISTEQNTPFTDQQRVEAISLATEQDLIQQYLADKDDYEVPFQPIQELDWETDQLRLNGTDDSGSQIHIESTSEDSVRIDREQNYAEDRASIIVRPHATEPPAYTVDIDMENNAVIEITDWEALNESHSYSDGTVRGP
ncbi:hypothetical protein C482_11126 [Natrialba chahannaoensis JCM 10990]|uniref:Uncharacterized protein n=1 Tax=Natrialba chahannaoensis JCM 10990 TaxID=1227492 RepID=M0AP01_9EURY|nr:hypothetical protein C482_11126 [Natrialba chahannaoensis JCM 10990]